MPVAPIGIRQAVAPSGLAHPLALTPERDLRQRLDDGAAVPDHVHEARVREDAGEISEPRGPRDLRPEAGLPLVAQHARDGCARAVGLTGAGSCPEQVVVEELLAA